MGYGVHVEEEVVVAPHISVEHLDFQTCVTVEVARRGFFDAGGFDADFSRFNDVVGFVIGDHFQGEGEEGGECYGDVEGVFFEFYSAFPDGHPSSFGGESGIGNDQAFGGEMVENVLNGLVFGCR